MRGRDRSTWRAYVGPRGVPYYFNSASGQSSWERPAELGTDPDESDFDSDFESSVGAAELGDGSVRAGREDSEAAGVDSGGTRIRKTRFRTTTARASAFSSFFRDSCRCLCFRCCRCHCSGCATQAGC